MTSVTITQPLLTAQVQASSGPSVPVEIAAPPIVQVAVQGQQGPMGAQGLQGIQGVAGPQGKSASYGRQIAVSNRAFLF